MSSLVFGFLIIFWASVFRAAEADEIPGFFLKITKNVPRIGRRSDGFFMNYKSIPRIGRSVDGTTQNAANNLLEWLQDEHMQVEKRRMFKFTGTPALMDREYSVVQPVNSNTLFELLEKDAISTNNIKFVHWKDFDVALQRDIELYAKVMSLGRAPDKHLKEDLNLHFGSINPFYDSKSSNFNANDLMPENNAQDMYSKNYDPELLHYNHL